MSRPAGRAVLVSGITASTAAGRGDGQRRGAPGPSDDGHLDRWVATLPLASLLLDARGAARASNPAWTALSRLAAEDSGGQGWLESVDVVDRAPLVERLRSAQVARSTGTFECRLATGGARRWTRWWWRPTGEGELVVCIADIDDEKVLEANLWQRATHDPLTGLLNRTQLLDLLERALQRRDRADASVAVIFVDLDEFKGINDREGHRTGDEVLREIAGRMERAIRPADVVARIGGDEFAVLCEDLHEPAEATDIAARVRSAIARPLRLANRTAAVTATTGIAQAQPGDTAEGLIARADRAMYEGKRHLLVSGPSGRAARSRGAKAARGRSRSVAHGRSQTVVSLHPVASVDGAGPPDQVLTLADRSVRRIQRAALSVRAASELSEDSARDGLSSALDDLDHLLHDLQQLAFAMQVDGVPDDRPRRALDALVDAERLLATEWARSLDHQVPVDARDRVARASRLATAALRALEPGTIA